MSHSKRQDSWTLETSERLCNKAPTSNFSDLVYTMKIRPSPLSRALWPGIHSATRLSQG